MATSPNPVNGFQHAGNPAMRIRRLAIIAAQFALFGALVLLILALYFQFFFRLQADYCLFDIMGEFPSPNGKQVALVIRESCGGATMPFLTSVAIKEPGKVAALKEAGRTFPYEYLKRADFVFRVFYQIAMVAILNEYRSLTI